MNKITQYPNFEVDQVAYELVPLDAPGMPEPGPDFLAEAQRLAGMKPSFTKIPIKGLKGAELKAAKELNRANQSAFESSRIDYRAEIDRHLAYLYCRALYHDDFSLPVVVKGRPCNAAFLPGHHWGFAADGPRPSDVMVIGKRPGDHELQFRRNFHGPSSAYLIKALEEVGVPYEEYEKWYVTNLVRHNKLDPARDTLASDWIDNCLPLLWQEIMLIKPKYILCLGTESAKALLGKHANVSNMAGRVVPLKYKAPFTSRRPAIYVDFSAQVMAVTHPAAVSHRPEHYDSLRDGMNGFWTLAQGGRVGDAEADIHHEVVYKERHLKAIVDGLLAREETIFAVDAEWQGRWATDPGAYLRTIQFSPRAKESYCVVLYHKGGRRAFKGEWLPHLQRLLKHSQGRHVRIGGHFFRADLPWLRRWGLDLEPEYTAADSPEETKTRGGWDTGYMVHAAFEALESYKLENLCMRWTTCPRWDVRLQKWKDGYCKQNNLKDRELEGYGECPDEILHPYANYDADGTRRLFDIFNGADNKVGFLDRDVNGNSCRQAFWNDQRATHAALEMEMTGVHVNRGRAAQLIETFNDVKNQNVAKLQEDLHWPTFNPGSAHQCREFLFGQSLNGSIDTATGDNKRLRPWPKPGEPSPIVLNLEPIKPAGTSPAVKGKSWEQIVRDGKAHLFNPSTDKETLGILGHQHPLVMQLRDIRFLKQVLQSCIKLPKRTPNGEPMYDEDGNPIHEGGLLYYINHDGRVRSHFFPVETGRWSSSRPNLQNLSKRREADYKRILGDPTERHKVTGELLRPDGRYLFPIRSMIEASPGCVLIEADLKSAELAGIAWFSGDQTMIEHVRRNMLDEDHPDYIDIHSRTAVRAFGLHCEPTKSGLEGDGLIHLRVAAKNVNFGIPYQRGALALARQCREENCYVTVEQAERLKAAYFESYPRTFDFLEGCKARVVNPGWICGAYGRYRRFQRAEDDTVLADQQRQACNFPIQNLVADAINLACWNLYDFRKNYRGPHSFRMVLQIHDALLFEVPVESVPWMVDEVIPMCMSAMVQVRPCFLDGSPMPLDEPFMFGVDTEIFTNWGEKLKRQKALDLGLPDNKRYGVKAA